MRSASTRSDWSNKRSILIERGRKEVGAKRGEKREREKPARITLPMPVMGTSKDHFADIWLDLDVPQDSEAYLLPNFPCLLKAKHVLAQLGRGRFMGNGWNVG
eukprot:3296277-Rhodomonas_salina.1